MLHDLTLVTLLVVFVVDLILFFTQKLSGPVAFIIGALCAVLLLIVLGATH